MSVCYVFDKHEKLYMQVSARISIKSVDAQMLDASFLHLLKMQ